MEEAREHPVVSAFSSLATQAYAEAQELLSDPEMEAVVSGGLTILCGPPIERPDLFLISFQGGASIRDRHETWPDHLVYLDYEDRPEPAHKFSRNLCSFARRAGLYEDLRESCVAVPAVFPQDKRDSANSWLARAGPKKRWRDMSVKWVERFVDAAQPKVIIILGKKTSIVLGLSSAWKVVERKHRGGMMTFGRAKYRGVPAIFCGHLSQGYVAAEVERSFREAKRIITRDA